MSLKQVHLSLGSNLGDRQANLRRAIEALERQDINVVKESSLYETAPQDVVEQPWFLNMAVECQTRLFPLQLLTATQRIENELGRRRTGTVRRGPRTIDIDILLFGAAIMQTPKLVIPHPRMFERRFVLEPLLEIAPDLRHPLTREPLRKSLGAVAAQTVRRVKAELV
jgi:2-amino-4-hydroxy-6-hydroxymethyldihydropteridine diphosphokinase